MDVKSKFQIKVQNRFELLTNSQMQMYKNASEKCFFFQQSIYRQNNINANATTTYTAP